MKKLEWHCGLNMLPDYDRPIILRYISQTEEYVHQHDLLSTFTQTDRAGHKFYNIGQISVKNDKIIFNASVTESRFKGPEKLSNMFWAYTSDDQTELNQNAYNKLLDLKKEKLKQLEEEYESKKKSIENFNFLEIDLNSFSEINDKLSSLKKSIEKKNKK